MSTDATMIRTGALVGAAPASAQGVRRHARVEAAIAAVAMMAIVGICLFVVVLAANRPTFYAPTTHAGFFPGWLAGPLGGLWPSFPTGSSALKWIWTFGLLAMYAAYVVAFAYVPRLRARWVIAAVVAAHVVMLMAPPLSLTDIFNYINYGRMEAVHHLNPYATIPYYEPHTDPSFELSNWHHLLSPYGPLFTVFTFALVPLGVAASFWTLKVVLMLASLGTIALVWACARLLGREPRQAIVFVGLNPLVLLWGLGGDHNDFLMMLLIMGAFYLLLRARSLTSPAADVPDLSAAPTAVWPTPLVTAGGDGPGRLATIRQRMRWPWRRPVTAVSLATGAGAGVAAGGASMIGATEAPPASGTTNASPGTSGSAPETTDAPPRTAGPAPAPEPSTNGSRAWAPLAGWTRPRAGDVKRLFWPLAPLDISAGVLLVVAVAIKASAAILLPVVLMALLVRPRDLVQVLIGVVVAAVGLGAMTYTAFGVHIPDLSTQAKLVTSVSVPNLIGLALGQGGETHTIKLAMEVVLVLGVLVSAWWASRHRDLGPDALVTGAGWASVVLVLTLSWVLPWYVLWTLPLAVLSRSRALRRTVLVLGVYLIFAWMPLQADLFRAIHFRPLGTSVGQLDQRETKNLLH